MAGTSEWAGDISSNLWLAMSETPPALAAEQRARVLIDSQLSAAGWSVQDRGAMNLFAGPGVAVRETIMAKGHGRADYLLYVDKRAVGVIEAKPAESVNLNEAPSSAI